MTKSFTVMRSLAKREKGRYCNVCGSDGDVEVHHKDGDRSNNELSNLIPLCAECHNSVHHKRVIDGKLKELKEILPDGKKSSTESTLVKAKVDDETNAYIERVRDSTDMNKTEATSYVLERATALDVTGVDE